MHFAHPRREKSVIVDMIKQLHYTSSFYIYGNPLTVEGGKQLGATLCAKHKKAFRVGGLRISMDY
jgi:hypothetical protein